MGRKTTWPMLVVAAILAVLSVRYLQGRYDRHDMKSALALVQGYRSPAGTTIPEAIARQHPGAELTWGTAVESSCFHHVRVTAQVPTGKEDPAADPLVYAFTVDINGPSIHPANERGQALLRQLGERSSARAGAATPSPATPSPATAAPATPSPAAPSPATPSPATAAPATAAPATPSPATPSPATPSAATPLSAAPPASPEDPTP